MIRYSSEVLIDRPPRAVFEALLDPALAARWTPMTDLSFDDDGPPRLGQRGGFRMTAGPIKGRLTMEIVDFEPERRLAYRIKHPSLDWLAVTSLHPEGDATRVTYAGEVSLRGWRRILEPAMAREVRDGEAAEIRTFKALLESLPTPGIASAT